MLELVERAMPVGVERAETDRPRRGRKDAEVGAVLAAAAYALPHERALVELVYKEGRAISLIARTNGERPSVVRARFRRLEARLRSREFRFVVAHARGWTKVRREVAEACFLRGLSVRATSMLLRRSQHEVRRQRDAVLAMLGAA